MRITVRDDTAALARLAAHEIADAAMDRIRRWGVVTVAFSGGSTPAPMLATLADLDLPWRRIHVFQVDERIAPEGHPDRNLEQLRQQLLDRVALPATNVHPMPVTGATSTAASRYADELRRICGDPAVLDSVHLGLGADGHVASLVPDDVVLAITDTDVAVTGPYQGRRRLTLTVPVLHRARQLLWLVTGADKAVAVRRLVAGDPGIPAARIAREDASLLLDTQAAAQLDADHMSR